tara:strand:+ start:2067 stop:2765 length:699 start_codon:yes stop_codon:yes gene_type:complete
MLDFFAATASNSADSMPISLSDPYTLIIVLVFVSIIPFVGMMISSFVKLVVVLSLIRNALGIQQIPPNTVINGLAMILSFYIMAPVVQDTYDIMRTQHIEGKTWDEWKDIFYQSKGPMQNFLLKHSNDRDRQFFIHAAKSLWPEHLAERIHPDDFMILIPAFTVSELSSAFQIGFLTYLPFIIIDLITSNILLAMGMMMVSPTVISLPFKLLLFVLVSGWSRLIQGIVLTYQ